MIINRFPEYEHLHIHWDHKFDGLSLLFASNSIRGIAITFLALFSPIYIWRVLDSFGLGSRISVFFTLGYFLIYILVKLLVLPISEMVGLRFGFKVNMYLSAIPFILSIPFLLWAKTNPFYLIPAAILFGIYIALFWWGYHGFFIESADVKLYGRAIGVANILATLVTVISPLLGALVVGIFGFTYLFWAAGAIFVIGIFLLIPAHNRKPRVRAGTREVLVLLRRHLKTALAYVGYAAESSMLASVWPLFIFFTVGTTLGVGEIASAAAVVAAFFTFGLGFFLDKHWRKGRKELISFGVPTTALTWIIRSFAASAPSLVFIDAAYKFVEQLYALPLEMWAYKKGMEGVDRAMLFRQYAITSGAILATVLVMILVAIGGSLGSAFFVAAFFSFFPLLSLKK